MGVKEIEITFNGMKEKVPEGFSIAQLIAHSNESDKALIVERNGKFVFPKKYEVTFLCDGDRVEFIQAACGG